MRWLKRLFSGKASPAPAPKPETPGPPPHPRESLVIGGPQEDTPLVLVKRENGVSHFSDRLTYEFENGKRAGTEPSRDELDAALAQADRVRILRGGLYRDRPFGVDVLLDSADPSLLAELRAALAIEADAAGFCHFTGFGAATLEFARGADPLATLAFCAGGALRWQRWKWDVRLSDPAMALRFFGRFGDLQEGPDDDCLKRTVALLCLTDAERHAWRGESYRALGDVPHALEECRQALALDPDCWQALRLQASVDRQEGRLEAAESGFTAALRAGAPAADTLRLRSVTRVGLGKLAEALEDFRAVLAEAPEDGDTQMNYGLTLAQLGRVAEARAALAEAATRCENKAVPLWNWGVLEFDANNFDKALEAQTALIAFLKAREAEAEKPKPPPQGGLSLNLCGAYLQRARTHANLSRHEEALRDFARAQRQEPENLAVYEWRAQFHRQRDEFDDALSDCDRMVELAPESEGPYLLRSQIRLEAGDFAGAMDDLDQAMPVSAAPHRLRGIRGELLLGAGRAEEARAEFDLLLEQKPDEAAGYFMRSQCWRHLGVRSEQLADLRQAMRLEPENGLMLNSLAWLLATCPDEALRDGAQAVAIGQKALALAKGVNPHLLDTVAAAYAESGDFDEACQLMRRAIAAFKTHLPPPALEPYRKRLALYEAAEPYRED